MLFYLCCMYISLLWKKIRREKDVLQYVKFEDQRLQNVWQLNPICDQYTIIFQSAWHLASESKLNLHTTIVIQISIGIQIQWNVHIKQESKHYTDQSQLVCVRWVFLKGFIKAKHVYGHTALNNTSMMNIYHIKYEKYITWHFCLHILWTYHLYTQFF